MTDPVLARVAASHMAEAQRAGIRIHIAETMLGELVQQYLDESEVWAWIPDEDCRAMATTARRLADALLGELAKTHPAP